MLAGKLWQIVGLESEGDSLGTPKLIRKVLLCSSMIDGTCRWVGKKMKRRVIIGSVSSMLSHPGIQSSLDL